MTMNIAEIIQAEYTDNPETHELPKWTERPIDGRQWTEIVDLLKPHLKKIRKYYGGEVEIGRALCLKKPFVRYGDVAVEITVNGQQHLLKINSVRPDDEDILREDGTLLLNRYGLEDIVFPVVSIKGYWMGFGHGTYVQELLPSAPFTSYLRRFRAESEEETISKNIGKALAEMHNIGLMHNFDVYRSIMITEDLKCRFINLYKTNSAATESQSGKMIGDLRRLLFPKDLLLDSDVMGRFNIIREKILDSYLGNLHPENRKNVRSDILLDYSWARKFDKILSKYKVLSKY